MMRNLVRRPLLIFSLCCALAVLVPLLAFAYDCTYYDDSEPTYFQGYGEVCAYTGNGCTECSDEASAESCVAAGQTDCFQRDQERVL